MNKVKRWRAQVKNIAGQNFISLQVIISLRKVEQSGQSSRVKFLRYVTSKTHFGSFIFLIQTLVII